MVESKTHTKRVEMNSSIFDENLTHYSSYLAEGLEKDTGVLFPLPNNIIPQQSKTRKGEAYS